MPGAFGAVFKAKSTVSGAVVALKVVNNDVDVSFEINVLKMINNECAWIVGFEDSFRIDETTYVCLEWCERGALGNIVRRTRAGLADEQIAGVVWQVAQALRFLHERHAVVHFDVKCDNLLLKTNGDVKLCDFGSSLSLATVATAASPSAARGAGSSSSSSSTVSSATSATADFSDDDELIGGGLRRDALLQGSPYWTAPEIIRVAMRRPVDSALFEAGAPRCGPVSCASDIWSLGIALIELADTGNGTKKKKNQSQCL